MARRRQAADSGGTPGVWNPPGLVPYLRELEGRHRATGFAGNDILHVLVGHRGPWLNGGQPINMPFALNRVRRRMADATRLAQLRTTAVARNRRLGVLRASITRLDLTAGQKNILHAAIEQAKQPLPRPSPPQPESRQPFWTPLVVNLANYLERAGIPTEGQRFAIVAKILHLASEGAFMAGPKGAARAKQRFYRGAGWTKKK